MVEIKDILQPVLIPDVTASDMLKREVQFAEESESSEQPESSSSTISSGGEAIPASLDSFDPDSFPRFSMCLGDFVEIYGASDNQSFWDGIATCFFVDTAPVVVDYIDVIFHLLKPGGVWVNQGPLLYHWTTDSEGNNDPRYSKSIEVSICVHTLTVPFNCYDM